MSARQRLTEWRRRLLHGEGPDALLDLRPEEALVLEAPAYDVVFGWFLEPGPGVRLTPGGPASPPAADGELRLATGPAELDAFHERARVARETADLLLPHLSIGALRARSGDADAVSPLLLVPVALRREESGGYRLQRGPGPPLLNPALAWLARPSATPLIGPVTDWPTLQPRALLDEVEAGLRDGGLAVVRQALLVLVPVGRWLLSEQLEAEATAMAEHLVVRVLAGEPAGPAARRPRPAAVDDPLGSLPPWDADGEQTAVLSAARRGAPVVAVAGPPGSGRTQTVANLLAAAIAEGKAVLVVGRTHAVLESLRARLAEAGLDRYCLMLRGSLADGSEFLGELRQALASRVEPWRALGPADDGLERRRARLAEHLKELHEPRWPLERSVADVLIEVTGLHEDAVVEWRGRQPELLTREQLSECLELTRRLVPFLALAREPEPSPWERCLRPGSGPAADEEWGASLAGAGATASRLRESAAALAAAHGLPPPANPAEVGRLVDLDAWVRRDPPTPDHWLRELDVPAAREEAEWWRDRMAAYLQERSRLEARFRAPFFELPDEALEDLEQAARRLEALLGVKVGIILGVQESLAAWLEEARAALPEWRVLAERLGEALELLGFHPSLESALHVAGLARLLTQPERPPAGWMDHRACARVDLVLQEARELQERRGKVRRAVLSAYTSSVTSLAAEPLVATFVSRYVGRWRFLRPGYHRVRRLLRRHRLDRRPPVNPLRDLRRLRFLKHCASALDTLADRHRGLLGEYASSIQGSLGPATRALETARQLLERTLGAAELEAVTAALRGPALPSVLTRWLTELEEALGRNDWLMVRCQEALPAGLVPGHGLTLRQLPLDTLEGWLAEVEHAWKGLLTRLERISSLRAGRQRGPLGLEEALDALVRRAGLRSLERKLEADATHLRNAYGGLFRGRDTDWAGVLHALLSVENARLLYGEGARPSRAALARLAETDAAECRQLLEQLTSAFARLAERFEQAHSRRRHPLDASDPWEVIEAVLAGLTARTSQREAWVELSRVRQEFESAELAWLFLELRGAEVPADRLAPAVRRAALLAWWRAQRAECPVLRDFDAQRLELDVAALREAARARRQRVRGEIVRLAEVRRPSPEVLDGVGDPARLDLRTLALQLRDALRTLKPVVMAGPFTAGLLPREMVFDQVLVLETEPIPVEEVVAALARGRQVMAFGSAGPEDGASTLGALLAAGVPGLRLSGDYRAPADSGAPGGREPGPAGRRNPLREHVARLVRNLGYDAVERAGPSAGTRMLWVRRRGPSGRVLLGIDAGEAEPPAGRTLAERYLILPDFAERLGCPLHRVHTLEWVEDHEAALGGLRKALKRATERQAAPGAAPEAIPYEVASLAGFALTPDALQDRARHELIVTALRHLVAVEGPVHRERAFRRILGACGVRATRGAERALEQDLRAAVDKGWIEERGAFLHAPGGSRARVRTPRRADPRSRWRASELPPEEVALAALMLLRAGGRMRRSRLLAGLARLFGLTRTDGRRQLGQALRAAEPPRFDFDGDYVALREE